MRSGAAMSKTEKLERQIVYSMDKIPEFASEDEERDWWVTHDIAEELGEDVTAEQHALTQHLKAKYRYVAGGFHHSEVA